MPRLLGERSELVPRRARLVGIEREPALPDRDRAEQEPVARQRLVESPGALGQGGEERVPGGETHPGTDGGDVVEVVPDALELEQDRACASEVGRRPDSECLLARVRVRDAVRDRARRARAHGVREAVLERVPLGGPLQPAMLVEQPGVDVEDAIAHDVEAEVPRLDDARMDRPDRYLIGVAAVNGDCPMVEREIVVDQRAQRLVADEVDAVEIRCFALVPCGSRREIHDRRDAAFDHGGRLDPHLAVRPGERRADEAPVGRRVEPGEAPRAGERVGDCRAIGVAHPTPLTRARAIALPGNQSEAAASPSRQTTVIPVSARKPRSPGGSGRRWRRALPASVAISACARPRKPRASSAAVAAAVHGRPAAKPPATMSTSLAKRGDGGRPASAPSETPIAAPSAGCVLAIPPTACVDARGSMPTRGVAA